VISVICKDRGETLADRYNWGELGGELVVGGELGRTVASI